MRVDLGDGVRVFVDIDGNSLVPDGDGMRERPTLILLHGGPGMDHSSFKPLFNQLTDICQVVMYDHRGNGRSEGDDKSTWFLDVWADDVVRLCDALGIEKPIVMGQSFGGMVAQKYLARHPEHPSKVIISSTSPHHDLEEIVRMFTMLGGPDAGAAARDFWTGMTEENYKRYLELCGPLYIQSGQGANPLASTKIIRKPEVLHHFSTGEQQTMDLTVGLDKAQCPVLLLAGALDPVCPQKSMETIRAALPEKWVQWELFENAGHGVYRDDPERAMKIIRDFILS